MILKFMFDYNILIEYSFDNIHNNFILYSYISNTCTRCVYTALNAMHHAMQKALMARLTYFYKHN